MVNEEFKDLTVEELSRGYVIEENGTGYRCIFCGEYFEDGRIYLSRDKNVTAQRGVCEHLYDVHGGSFVPLINLDKQLNGLSDSQKKLLTAMFEEKDNKEISSELNINATTVRTHKFHLQKIKREAKILLALLEQIENEEIVKTRKKYMIDREEPSTDVSELPKDFNGNTLHPFFTQCNFK